MDREFTGRRLLIGRLAWVVFTLLLACLHIASQAAAFKELHAISLTPAQMQSLQAMHLSIDFYTAWVFSWQLPLPLAWGGMGLLIFLRKSRDWNGLLISAMMIGSGLASSIPLWKSFTAAYPGWAWLVPVAAFIGNMCVNSFFFTFPTGHFAPRWTLAVALGLSVANILLSYDFALPASMVAFAAGLGWLQPVFFLVVILSVFLGPIYRYRWASTPSEKEQIRWVVFTILVGMVLFAAAASTAALLPGNDPLQGDITFITTFIQPLGWDGVFVLIAVSIAVSILRYRLFDIDLIIRRTLLYTLITLLLGAAYLGGVTLLQSLFVSLGGQQSPAALVISTLVIASLFNPLRRRIQDLIDRRFYRQRYNAEQALAAFAAVARSETDLPTLTGKLVGVVQATIQPEQAILWLKPAVKELKALHADPAGSISSSELA